LLPLMLLAAGCIAFTFVGVIVLACVPSLPLTMRNVGVFVAGAIPGALALGYLYGRAFADARNEFSSTSAVVGSFVVMVIGGTAGGAALVWLGAGVGRRDHSR
jgi:hypothetical protein